MIHTKKITMKKIILFPLFLICAYIGRSQVLEIGKNPLPCKCDVKIQFYDFRTFSIANTPVDSNILKKEKKAEARYKDGIPCVDYYAFQYVKLRIYLLNYSNTDILPKGVYVDGFGYLSIHFDKIRNGKRIPVKFDYVHEQHLVDKIVKRGQIDTTDIPFYSSPYFPIDLSQDTGKSPDIDTGVYVVKGSYLQKCNGKVTRKYTNEVFFRLIE